MKLHHLLFTLTLTSLLALSACTAQPARPVALLDTTTQPAPASDFIHAKMLIIVRHADINVADKKTLGAQAPLTPRGLQRAGELAYALKDAGITRIVTSETLRTQETAADVAKELHIDPETPFAHGSSPAAPAPTNKKAEAANVIKFLQATSKDGDVILLVDHHSVIPTIMNLLGYTEPPFIEDTEFDRLYVVIPEESTHTYKILRLRYGGDWGPGTPSLDK